MTRENLLSSLLVIFFGFTVQAQSLVKTMSSTNGTVYSVTNNAGIYYIGGSFTYVGLQTGTAGLLTSSSDIPNLDFPAFTGEVRCAISDGSNGWYVGGSMYQADGNTCAQLVHVLSGNTIDPSFNASPNGAVYALLLKGTTLYVGAHLRRSIPPQEITLAPWMLHRCIANMESQCQQSSLCIRLEKFDLICWRSIHHYQWTF
jgi:hypothetical protein